MPCRALPTQVVAQWGVAPVLTYCLGDGGTQGLLAVGAVGPPRASYALHTAVARLVLPPGPPPSPPAPPSPPSPLGAVGTGSSSGMPAGSSYHVVQLVGLRVGSDTRNLMVGAAVCQPLLTPT